ncbi:hypothetical protein B0T10DRAFT_399024, partial [Thelonectria olida]
HNEDAKTFDFKAPETNPFGPSGLIRSYRLEFAYTTASLLIQLKGNEDHEAHGQQQEDSLAKLGGSVLHFTNYPPRGISPVHQLVSCNYASVIVGEMECLLDSGEARTLCQGDVFL